MYVLGLLQREREREREREEREREREKERERERESMYSTKVTMEQHIYDLDSLKSGLSH